MDTDRAAMLAPLTPLELAVLTEVLWRACNRACDTAEQALHDMDTVRAATPAYREAGTRAHAAMALMRDLSDLHTTACTAAAAAAQGKEK